MCHFFHCYFAVCFGEHLIYYIYARKIFHNLFSEWYFFWKTPCFFVPFPIFQICYMTVFAMRTDLLLLLSWYKRRSNKKKKSRLNVSGATAERPFWCWKKNSLRCTTLKQHFSAPPVHSSAHAPPPRPFYYTPRRFAVGFGWCFCLTFGLRCWLL